MSKRRLFRFQVALSVESVARFGLGLKGKQNWAVQADPLLKVLSFSNIYIYI